MVTILDVISRTKSKYEKIIDNVESLFSFEFDVKKIDEIMFIGSGSSYSSCLSTSLMCETLTGLKTSVMLPNMFISKSVYNPNCLYVFVSQTGTSSLTIAASEKLKDKYLTAALTGDLNSKLANACKYKYLIDCGYEEYTYATLGFSCSMISELLLCARIGFNNNHLSETEYKNYLNELSLVGLSNENVIVQTINWFNMHKQDLLKKDNFIFYGGRSFYGLANEAALKIMEITKKYVCAGYEIDDGMHGPNYCFDERTALICLDDGLDHDKAVALMNLMKNEYQSGYLISDNIMDDKDLKISFRTSHFKNLEIISFIQVFAYLLAVEINVDIFTRDDPLLQKTKGKGYFNMHESK